MGELYRYFLNSARLGFGMLEAIAKSARRFVLYPAGLVYNAAVAGYSSVATGRAFIRQPGLALEAIAGNGGGGNLRLGQAMSDDELVGVFSSVVEDPFDLRLTFTGEANGVTAYQTINARVEWFDTWLAKQQELVDRIKIKYPNYTPEQIAYTYAAIIGRPRNRDIES